ncbi:hypothetical protein RJZ56_005731 [Blastomyces dermatitidis]|uniref:DUF7707 domain-containing protein n=2 Tax=Ajellomyces dermatitidis TaxID=5039 RepID=F2TJP6_AJEDA|nr:uncharacterized protein BDCG_08005 [Blastomyces dermatitidis ER-3]EEQ84736.1 hypothetical protein BDCG_08005 [Blastomyces dermatitidis ER-3]EGE83451.1 hypothetical protein BDDG_06395 [Blastomyces dermatitidis ATCC 18188]EQL36714.1 hypothetical protein BDFG_01684 [Blastomyces dermatitidis ATCC 26199]
MLFPTILLALSSISGVVNSQTIDPMTIPVSTRSAWCLDQVSSCPLICLQERGTNGEPKSNDCDPETLTFSCVCSSGLSPNASEFSQTLPYYICTEINSQCVRNCNGNSGCQTSCREDNPCGAQSPRRVTTTPSATSTGDATGTATNDVVYTGLGEDSATRPGSGAAGLSVALQVGQVYAVGVVVAGFLVGFSVLM